MAGKTDSARRGEGFSIRRVSNPRSARLNRSWSDPRGTNLPEVPWLSDGCGVLTWNSRCGRGAISFPSSNSASTKKRLEVFEADEAALLGELRNYSQHKFLPYLAPSFHFHRACPWRSFSFG